MKEKSKIKKRIITITVVVLSAALILLLIGYFSVNIMFSKVSDSFYQSTVSGEDTTTEETEQPVDESENLRLSEFPEEFPEHFPLAKMQLTGEQFKALTDKISFNDKLSVLNILRTSLDPEEYKELLAMLSNGITKEEIQRAYAILRAGLSGENKQKILGYYNKYIDLIQ